MKELDDIFAEVEPFIARRQKPVPADPYGRGPQFDHAAFNADIAAGFKICTKCREKKPLDAFNKTKSNKLGIKGWCKACESIYNDSYHQKNGDAIRTKDREEHYTRKYGLDPELSRILADPDNRIAKCPLCKQVERLVLDHDHETKVVRGLLCSACNSMLGYARESIDTLYEAIAYLKKHRGV